MLRVATSPTCGHAWSRAATAAGPPIGLPGHLIGFPLFHRAQLASFFVRLAEREKSRHCAVRPSPLCSQALSFLPFLLGGTTQGK